MEVTVLAQLLRPYWLMDIPRPVPASVARTVTSASAEEVYSISGTLSVVAGQLRLYNRSGFPWTLLSVYISVGTAPTGADLIVDININGTTIFSNQSNRPTITDGSYTGVSGTPDVVTVAPGDYLTVDTDQIGSTISGADLVAQLPVVR